MSRLPVVSSDGNAWGTVLNDFLSVAHNADGSLKNLFFNVKDPAYGAKGDGKLLADGAITTGTPTLTSASAAFTAADVGKSMSVIGAGTSGANLNTTILAYVNATTVTLAANAGTSVLSGATFVYGTDDTTAIQAAITAVPSGGGTVFFPYGVGMYLISSSLIVDTDCLQLVGFGNRGIPGNATLLMSPSTDPTWAIIVGNTKYINSNLIQGLCLYGRNSTTTTGGGILFRSNGGKILQTKVQMFGGTGIQLSAFSGTNYENYLEDINLIKNGMNTGTPGDGLVIASSMSDCEYHRVISWGDPTVTSTRHGINNSGFQHKFVDCHTYFCTGDGFHNTAGGGVQLLGGEWETNLGTGINMAAGYNNAIIGAACFGNSTFDIELLSNIGTIISSSVCTGTLSKNIALYSCYDCVISDCICKGPCLYQPISLDSNCYRINVHDCVVNSSSNHGIEVAGTYCNIHDNIIEAGGLFEVTGANNNNIHDNTIIAGGITLIGTATFAKDNIGYNPRGQVTAPTFPATTVAATNTTGVDVTAFIANSSAAITVIQIAGVAGSYVTTGMTIPISGTANIRIPAGGSVKFTYASGTPTWTWFGD